MDRNRDGVVTYEEFLETCQQVTPPPSPHPCPHRDISMGLGTPLVVPPPPVGTCDVSVSPWQDVDIMSSMQIFENTI